MGPTRSGMFRQSARLEVETLESRLVPYALTGAAWPRPELVTLAVVADGTNLGGVSSNLVSVLNNRFGSSSAWQHQLLKAAQVWAQQTNLNFALADDSGAPIGSGSYLQANPSLADIRIGGFNFGRNTLGQAYLPPPVNNFSIAGDTQFNTGQPWVINTTGGYDLFTVAMHEIGHALGLGHSTSYSSALYPTYAGIRAGLGADDIRGIRALYSGGLPRSHDIYDIVLPNNSLAAASYLDLLVDPLTLTAQVANLDITSTSDIDYFTVGIPAATTGTLTVTVQTAGLSLLAPSVGLYNSSLQLVGFATGLGQYGSTLTMTVDGVKPGERYYLCVLGADASPFGTGRYALNLNLGDGPSPVVPLPNTLTLNGNPLVSGSALPEVDDHDRDHQGKSTSDGVNEQRSPSSDASAGQTLAADGNLIRGLARRGPVPVAAQDELHLLISRPVFIHPTSASLTGSPLVTRVQGGTQSEAATPEVESETPVMPSTDPTTPPATEAEPRLEEMTPEQVREAVDICFHHRTEDARTAAENTILPGADAVDGVAQVLDPLAAVCLALMLGGHWTTREEEQRRRHPPEQ